MTRKLLFVAVALSAACFKGEATVGTCNTSSDCPLTGSTCNTNVTPHVCVYACPQICAATESCVDGQCVAARCVPDCDADHLCDTNVHPPQCVVRPDGTTTVTKPAAQQVVGGPQITFEATAGAPGGPTKVVFRIEQGGVSKGTVTVTSGNNGVFSGVLSTAGIGLVTGAANVVSQVFWTANGVETSKDSTVVPVTVDMSAPSITAGSPLTDHAFYSSAVNPTGNATVSVSATDVGAAGVNANSARLNLGTHSYPATTAPDGGTGAYTFTVPLADTAIGAGGQATVGFVVAASDKVGNAGSFDGGTISIDNKPPTFANLVVDSTSFFDGGSTLDIRVDVTDPAGGSGLDPALVGLLVSGQPTPIAPSSVAGDTRHFTPLGADLQPSGQQAPVSFTFVAKDLVANPNSSAPQTVKVDRAAPVIGTVTVTDNSVANGYYAADGGANIPVTVVVDDGATGSGAATAKLTVDTSTLNGVAGSPTATAVPFAFTVSPSLHPGPTEGLVSFTVSAADAVGNTTAATTPTAKLKIDNIGPVVSSVVVNGGDATVGNVKWFKQLDASDLNTQPDIDVQADIVDLGSGVDPTSVQLVLQSDGTTRVDHGTPALTSGHWHFSVARVGIIASGNEGTIDFKAVAKDLLGHPQQPDAGGNVSLATLGVDGKKPQLTFSVNYPASGTDCDSTLPGGGADLGIVCGHDGSHWWRRGLGTAGAELTDMVYSATEGGSGLNTGSGTCAITGSGAACTPTWNGSQFAFKPNFSTATLANASTATGGGTATVTVGASDAVGNTASASSSAVAVSRLRWVQKLLVNATLNQLKGAPIVTSRPQAQIIVAGNSAADPIVSLKPTGGIIWTGGKAQGITTVSNNMAYDSTTSNDNTHPTPMLYVLQSSALIAMNVTAAGVNGGKYYNCSVAGSVGQPVIAVGGASARVLVVDQTSNILVAYGGTPSLAGTGCIGANPSIGLPSPRDGAVLAPVTYSGGVAYFGYDDSGGMTGEVGIASVNYAGAAFSGLATHALGHFPFGMIAVADSIFFGDNGSKTYQSVPLAFGAPNWTSVAFTGTTNLVASMVVAKGLALGALGTSNGTNQRLRAYDKNGDGTAKWTYPASGVGLISPPLTASDGTIYLSDSGNNEFVAISPGASSATTVWTFKGSTGFALAGVGTEASLDSNGIVYFGQDSGNVYALITDVGTPAAAVGADWPKTGFDNCNSGNASFSCQ